MNKNKAFVILLLFTLVFALAGCSSNNADEKGNNQAKTSQPQTKEFTLHNGVKFGMSVDEVTDLEKGISFEDGSDYKLIRKTIGLSDYRVLLSSESMTLAGEEGSKLIYLFDKDKLVTCFYLHNGNNLFTNTMIPEDNNTSVINKLTEKYGKPIFSDKIYVSNAQVNRDRVSAYNEVPRNINTTPNYIKIGKYLNAMDVHVSRIIDGAYNLTCYQWLQECENGYVNIMFYYAKYAEHDLDFRIVSYTYVTDDEMKEMIDNSNSFNQSLNDDL